jgi:hypothetical protein
MEDLQKLVEQWMSQNGIQNLRGDGLRRILFQPEGQGQLLDKPIGLQELTNLCRLAMQHAAEEAAKCCEDKERRKWEILTVGRPMEGIGPLDCAHAIRERFKAL